MPRTITTPTVEAQSKVEGVIQINGLPAERVVRAFGYDSESHTINSQSVNLSKSLGQTTSNPTDGSYSITLNNGYNNRVFVVAFDNYGDEFVADMSVNIGDRVHPTIPNGYVWEATSAGTLPSTEPTWVINTDTSQSYGTASMIAKAFYQPMVQGPVAPRVTQEPSWSPALLFTNNEQGIWYDPYDLTTMFQDKAGTIPVTADGDPIGLILDKSGNDNHAYSLGANRPVYKTDGQVRWIAFNGVDQYLNAGSWTPFELAFFAYQLSEGSGLGSLIEQQFGEFTGRIPESVRILLNPAGNLVSARNRDGGAHISKPEWELASWDEPFLVGFQEFFTDSALSGTPVRVYERLNFNDRSYSFNTSPAWSQQDVIFGAPDPYNNTNAWKGKLYGFVSVLKYITFEEVEKLNSYFSGT